MEHIVNEILEWCQNDKEYLQELIDRLQEIANTEDDEDYDIINLSIDLELNDLLKNTNKESDDK